MKKFWLIGVIAIIVILIGWMMSSYNGLVDSQTHVETQLSNLNAQYQRRADLIPNLQEIVKGAAEAERGTLTEVIQARNQAAGSQLTPEIANDPEKMKQFEQVQQQYSSALSRLMVVVERYPDLKSQINFTNFMGQLEGTENRITVARRDYNAEVAQYNMKVRRFPGNVMAGMFGFAPYNMFQAAEGSQNAPRVDFNNTPASPSTTPAPNADTRTSPPKGPARPEPAPAR